MTLLKTPRLQPNPEYATRALESLAPEALVSYREYFTTITPSTPEEIFRRGLFAFASVHTSWQYNLALYVKLWDLSWLNNVEALRTRIVASRAGLFEGRTRAIWKFRQKFWNDPGFYRRKESETWSEFRDRLQEDTLGLGHAKTSFFIELCSPNEAAVLCADVHILRLYSWKNSSVPRHREYTKIEAHWLGECARLGVSPVAARWYLWDTIQGSPGSSRYWSYVLENTGSPPTMAPSRQAQLHLF